MKAEDKQYICSSLRELANKGKPKNTEELAKRINGYFDYCQNNNMPIGIESLSLSLGITRQQFWNWCNGNNCNKEWQEICLQAKQYIYAFIENATLTNKINNITGIFLFKSVCGYEETPNNTGTSTAEKIATLDDIRAELLKSNQE